MLKFTLGGLMTPKRLPLAVMLVVLAWTAAARADSTDEYIARAMKEFHLPGLALLVVRDGQVVKAAGYGFADVERKIPVTPETVFKIGSVSKQLIATAIMLLVQDGRLTVDDPAPLNGNATAPYGFGWHIGEFQDRRVIRHGGGLPGFSSFSMRSLDVPLSIVVLTNGDDVYPAGIAANVALIQLRETTKGRN
jgi:hypothetical protein